MKQKTNFLKKSLAFLFMSFFSILNAQNSDPAFKTFYEGNAFTSIAVDLNKNVWAGTTQQGIFFLDRAVNDTIFKLQNIGTNPRLASLRIQSLAADKSGNIWVGHGGVNASNSSGGVERININTLQVEHLSPDADARGLTYTKRNGLATLNAQQITVDVNNKVWVAHKYHELASANYVVTPGTFSSKMADTEAFDAVGTWKDITERKEDLGLPYPAYTFNPPMNKTPQTRTCNAISTGSGFVWVSVIPYEVHLTEEYLSARLLQYTLDGNFVAQYSIESSKFIRRGGNFNGVYATNNNRGVWVTSNLADNGFSVLKNGQWHNMSDSNLMPPGTRFNQGAIWGDFFGKVYLGTNNGLIVYDGIGAINDPDSYTLYTKTEYNTPRSKYCPEMVSNNITAGTSEATNDYSYDSYYSWIATSSGIMKGFFPPGEMIGYHIINRNKDIDYTKKEFYDEKNRTPFVEFHKITNDYIPKDKDTPSFAADGTVSSIIRYYTKDAVKFYTPGPAGSKYIFTIGYYPILSQYSPLPEIPGDTENIEYKARYGELFLRPLETYGDNVNPEDLDYVEVVYKHPEYIKEDELNNHHSTHYTLYSLYIMDKIHELIPERIFFHPIKFSLPPVLLGHGVWSDISSVNKIKNYLQTKGYKEEQLLRAWRENPKLPENPFKIDAGVIPTYIKQLRINALDNKVSAGKVNVIVHSRGGLYTRAYIEEIDPRYKYNDDINSLITLNTPHSGSQEANAVLDQRIIIPKIFHPIGTIITPFTSGSTNLDHISFSSIGPLKIGDIFQGAILVGGTISKEERKTLWGAKNLTVINDDLSGSKGPQTSFIKKLNDPVNLKKLKDAQVPIHVVATNFSFCKQPGFCENAHFEITTPKILNQTATGLVLAYETTRFLLKTKVSEGLDNFMKYLFNGDTNDLIVPDKSMKAGLPSNYISSFETQNAPHTDPFLDATGVCGDTVVHNGIFKLLKEDLRLSDKGGSFTKKGISPPALTYNFLSWFSGFPSSKQADSQNPNGKIVINPDSFTSGMSSGSEATFEVYQENLNKIIIVCDYPGLENQYISMKEDELTFKNNFSFTIPEEFSGKFNVTAYGFSEGQLIAMHTVQATALLPLGLTLQTIHFEEPEDSMPEQSSYIFNLLGTFSDGVERRINDMAGISYSIDDLRILERTDNQTLKSHTPGTATLSASINSLTATLSINVRQDLTLLESIVTDFYPEYEATGPVKLTWDTFREYQSKNFTLERSENNTQNFIRINQQPGKGTDYNPSSYTFSDNTSSGHVFYRLKLFDLDDQEVYSEIIEIDKKSLSVDETTLPADKENKLLLAPNPVKTSTGNLFIKSDFSDVQSLLNIYDINGRLVYTQRCNITIGEQKISFEIPSNVANGIYLVQLKTKNYVKSVKLVLQR